MATKVLGLKTFAASDPVDYNEINDNYSKIDTGVKTALQGRAAHNLFDNSWFVNPVNQRGATSWASSGYTIDRWRTNSAITVNLSSTGITMDATSTSGELQQNVRGLPNGTYTFAALVNGVVRARVFTNDNGTITNVDNSNVSFGGSGYITAGKGSGDYYFQIKTAAGYTNTVAWAALYEGSYTADTLPAYQPKGYAAELAECQRYYQQYNEGEMSAVGNIESGNIYIRCPLRAPMRVAPSLVQSSVDMWTTYNNTTSKTEAYTFYSSKPQLVNLKCTSSVGSNYQVVLASNNAAVSFSADL